MSNWNPNIVANGIWKFDPEITIAELEKLCHEWLEAEDGFRYYELFVRVGSKDQPGIVFMYCFDPENEDNKTKFEEFVRRMKDQLYKRFGVNFLGWDVTSKTYMVKQAGWSATSV